MLDKLDEDYWSKRYQDKHIGWDLGEVSPPIKHYIDQIHQKNITILIPGSGNGYEATYLFHHGFKKTFILDISKQPLNTFKANNPDFPDNQILHQDFFNLQATFDLIIEQTFFCALIPAMRHQYVEKMLTLLKPGAKLVGLLFNEPLFADHPPFGGNMEEYLILFKPYFEIQTFELCRYSIAPRQGKEIFMILQKPKS